MKKAIKIILAAFIALCVIGTPVAMADDGTEACKYMNKKDPNYDLVCKKGTSEDAENRVANVLYTVYTIAGIGAVVVMIIGGIFYMISQGDSAKTVRAKHTIMYALIGLLIVILAFAITAFIINRIGG